MTKRKNLQDAVNQYAHYWIALKEGTECPHLAETGDEGPVELLGRWPRRWKCDSCGRVREDTESDSSRRGEH